MARASGGRGAGHHVGALVVVDEVAVGHEHQVLAVALAAAVRRHHAVRDEVRQEGRACAQPQSLTQVQPGTPALCRLSNTPARRQLAAVLGASNTTPRTLPAADCHVLRP